jgi:hypothetical protein
VHAEWDDPADTSEKRDWDLPASVHGHGAPQPAGGAPRDDRGEGVEPPPAPRHDVPSDESEKRDWDLP